MTSTSREPANPNAAPLPELMPTQAEARASQLENAETGPEAQQTEHVDLDSPENVNWWLRELDVTRDQLEAAVQAVGTRAPDVRAYFKGSASSTRVDRPPHTRGR